MAPFSRRPPLMLFVRSVTDKREHCRPASWIWLTVSRPSRWNTRNSRAATGSCNRMILSTSNNTSHGKTNASCSYIGELMQTSKITSGPLKIKNKKK